MQFFFFFPEEELQFQICEIKRDLVGVVWYCKSCATVFRCAPEGSWAPRGDEDTYSPHSLKDNGVKHQYE